MRITLLALLAAAACAQPTDSKPWDDLMEGLMRRYDIPGAALAVATDGRLIVSRAYGWADVENKARVQPDSLFRIASLAKPVTAVAVMKLVDEGRLDLDARAFELLRDLLPAARERIDPRLFRVTVRHLLWHQGGWDRDRSFDPMFRPGIAARAVKAPEPASAETVIRYMLTQPLDFEPGERAAYSNFGYCVLGRIVERASGMSYERWVRERVLRPAGIERMRLARSLPEHRLPGEVKYYSGETAGSVFPSRRGAVPRQYGGFHIEAMDAHGGWVASTIDYVRFLDAIDGRSGARLLTPAAVETMTARPPHAPPAPAWYAMGFNVMPRGASANWWHDGGLAGTRTLAVRTHHGYTWAVFCNAMPPVYGPFIREIDRGLWEALGRSNSTAETLPKSPSRRAANLSGPSLP